MKFTFPTELETQAFAEKFAKVCEPPLILFFQGELGAGKTTLIRAILKNLNVQGPIKSPTFSLVEVYDLASMKLCHVDLYRLKSPEELEYLGLRDYWDQNTIGFIEWPERASKRLPMPDIRCSLDILLEGHALTMVGNTERGNSVLAKLG